MQIKECFSTTKEDIEAKKYNILVPICLGNKFFAKGDEINDNVRKYVKWALENTKGKVLILVVDKIQNTNYFVRNHTRTEEASRRRVLKDGEKIKENIKQVLLDSFSLEERSKISLIRYEDYEDSDPDCIPVTHKLHEEFKNNPEFSQAVLKAVKSSITDRTFNDAEYWRLCDYVLDEFALAYNGVEYKGDYYGLFPYPVTDSVLYFIVDIQQGKIFTEISKKLPERKIGVVILNEN